MKYVELKENANTVASSSTCNLKWYLIHCKPFEDARALENLERQGFECFMPVRRVERLRCGRKWVRSEPLFPRYLFIRLDAVNDNWYSIRSTRGVTNIVRFNADPLPIPDEVVDGIRARLTLPATPELYLTPGERVRIVDGAFSQLEAIFLTSDGDERIVLLLNMLQHEQKLVFPVHAVRKLPA